ncbi:MAG: DUF1553 domain-containing protein [Pirellulales bacterium]
MSARRFADCLTLAVVCLLAHGELRGAPIVCLVCPPLAFEIVEGLPDKKTWDFEVAEPTTRFTAFAFALSSLPKKYNSTGVIDDRAAPFLVRGTAKLELSKGEYRLLLRARGAARLSLDGKVVLETKFRVPSADGHGAVPELASVREPGLALLPAENQEQLATIELDGQPHEFRLETIVGDQKLRPELGEISVSIAGPGLASPADEPSFLLLAPSPAIPLSQPRWAEYKRANRAWLAQFDTQTRRGLAAQHDAYWKRRHEIARRYLQEQPLTAVPDGSDKNGELSPVDRFLTMGERGDGPAFTPLVDDFAFLRRVSLDTVGAIPTPSEIAAFMNDNSRDRRARAVDRLLEDPRWADHWTSYWQDVLAENPGILKPELNNTGAFRSWIYESLLDNKPLDRFATDLVMMEGSKVYGGPAGFGMATQNDAPMAEKAHVLAKAFLAVELKCARCHDAPFHPFKQKDTFSLAAMLDRKPQKLPKTSTVPVVEGGRVPLVSISLKPGERIEAAWPFDSLVVAELPDGLLQDDDDDRERFAAILTSPANRRFAEVIVNRVWTRYIGWGLASSVDDWHDAERRYPELLEFLARDFVQHGYDFKHLARTILQTRLYQSQVVASATAEVGSADTSEALGPARRRMSAEQIVDSLFLAVEKPFNSEELTFDPAGRSPANAFGNLGHPRRAWQFTSLSNERDRPALSMPVAQSVVDVLVAFGWRESRQNPLTLRDEEANVLQPLMLANGVVGARVASLSDDSAITALALIDQPPEALVQAVYLRLLTRAPRSDEEQTFVELLNDGYATRRTGADEAATVKAANRDRRTAVAWSNHHDPEATRLKIEMERATRAGDPPTVRLETDWRERMEDMVWALVNSPEFLFVP